jgi:hypothetical protein
MPERQTGQTMVEFATVVAAFLLVLFAAVSAAFHSIQRAMAETAAAAGVQLAAGGSSADPGAPAFQTSYQPTHDLLQPVMWGTTIVEGTPGQPCPNLPTVPSATLMVCAYPDGTLVAERIVGRPAYLIPFLANVLPWSVDVTVEMHQVSFQA